MEMRIDGEPVVITNVWGFYPPGWTLDEEESIPDVLTDLLDAQPEEDGG
jgi:hypothetical protein